MTIQDEMRLADLTVGEFKSLIRAVVDEVVQQAVFQLEQQLPDPDEGLEIRPEIAARLQESLGQNGALLSIDDVKRELKLNG
jgi:hypothetical protein